MTENDDEYGDILAAIARRQKAAGVPNSEDDRKAPTTEELSKIKGITNVTNSSRFFEEIRRRDALDQQTAMEWKRSRLREDILKWEDKIDARWKNADIDGHPDFNPAAKAAIENAMEELRRARSKPAGIHPTSLLFIGKLGRGKTWSAYAAVKELVKRDLAGPGQIYASTEMNLSAITYAGYKKNDLFAEILNGKYKAYLIDDVGRGKFKSPAERGEIWFEIINKAYAQNMPLYITSNLPINNPADPGRDLEGWIGKAALDRFKSMVPDVGLVIFNETDKRSELSNSSTPSARRPINSNSGETLNSPQNFRDRQASKKINPAKKDELF